MRRPYVTINAAMSCDGKIATCSREKLVLSTEEDGKIVDRLRRDADAVLVGGTTLAQDNPRLVLRHEENRRHRVQMNLPEDPAKVVISPCCDIDLDSNFLQLGNAAKYVFTTTRARAEDTARVAPFATIFQAETERIEIPSLLETLYGRGIRKLLVEGGGSTNFEFIQQRMVDELRIAIAPAIIGGADAPTLVDGTGFRPAEIAGLELLHVEVLGPMVVIRYKFASVIGLDDGG
ncbi:MAG: dihydrofolate reductase family protein [Candidatus Peribacteraceae bacterium]|jgi:2,5-diamino-6-hydroxy-4-(5-phosphoribosylamino)pyrimidine 1'-reductase|nr:dihydrofolate reductase family protein [Candidatus Peribacteraceae bacterium]